MDYEKKYKEALENARQEYNTTENVERKQWLEELFPELRESEDERIIEWIIDDIRYNINNEPFNTSEYKKEAERAIAWLEKQGCQESVDKEYTFKSIPRLLDMIEPTDRAKSYCKKLIDSLLKEGYATDAKIVSDCLKQMNGEKVAMAVMDIEKQGEQKPRYSIGDVLCDKSCTTLNKDTQHNFEIIDIRDGMYICDNGSFPISQQDEYELVAKKIEQNHAWSEGDEARLMKVIWYVDNPMLSVIKDTMLVEWLKSIKNRVQTQPKQKWSEEDKDMVENILGTYKTLEDMLDLSTEQDQDILTSMNFERDWLKQLKQRIGG